MRTTFCGGAKMQICAITRVSGCFALSDNSEKKREKKKRRKRKRETTRRLTAQRKANGLTREDGKNK